MVVCAHGDVSDFCIIREMEILEQYSGDLSDYRGNCPVIVTDQRMTRQEYDSLKCTLFGRGVELVSTEWTDDEVILRLLHNQIQNRGKRGGRQTFGFMKKNGQIVEIPKLMYVARRIIELRDSGMTLKEIQNFPEIHHLDYKKISVSTIQQIIKNREKYEK